MRINVYDEEIIGEVQRLEKTADTGAVFVGVRIFLASPDVLHRSEEDDDRSAVTFWFEKGDEKARWVIRSMLQALDNAISLPDPVGPSLGTEAVPMQAVDA